MNLSNIEKLCKKLADIDTAICLWFVLLNAPKMLEVFYDNNLNFNDFYKLFT